MSEKMTGLLALGLFILVLFVPGGTAIIGTIITFGLAWIGASILTRFLTGKSLRDLIFGDDI